jgi:acylphosphatase
MFAEPAPPLRVRLRIEGAVQGVGFRWWTIQNATERGLRGTVKNLPDGAVEVEMEGSREDIEGLRTLLSTGPHAARVERVEEIEAGQSPLPDDFQARY